MSVKKPTFFEKAWNFTTSFAGTILIGLAVMSKCENIADDTSTDDQKFKKETLYEQAIDVLDKYHAIDGGYAKRMVDSLHHVYSKGVKPDTVYLQGQKKRANGESISEVRQEDGEISVFYDAGSNDFNQIRFSADNDSCHCPKIFEVSETREVASNILLTQSNSSILQKNKDDFEYGFGRKKTEFFNSDNGREILTAKQAISRDGELMQPDIALYDAKGILLEKVQDGSVYVRYAHDRKTDEVSLKISNKTWDDFVKDSQDILKQVSKRPEIKKDVSDALLPYKHDIQVAPKNAPDTRASAPHLLL
jgi:hypothetical protein